MREKVALNASIASPATSSILPSSTNILQPCSISSASSCLPAATTSFSSAGSCSSNTQTARSIDVSLNITSPQSSSISQIFNQITPIQPVLVDEADEPPPPLTDSCSYTTLQPCALDKTTDRQSQKRKTLTNSRMTHELLGFSTEKGKHSNIF